MSQGGSKSGAKSSEGKAEGKKGASATGGKSPAPAPQKTTSAPKGVAPQKSTARPASATAAAATLPKSSSGRGTQRKAERERRAEFRRLPKGPHGGIQLLLIQSVDHLGKQGDVVEVKPGYANNFLIPQGLATLSSDHHRRMVEKHKAKLLEIEKQRLSNLRTLADSLAKQSITIEANANDEGHLYGSVGAPDISAALKQAGFAITPDQVRLQGPLKELGLYTVKVHLHQEIESDLKVWVVPSAAAESQKTT